MSSRFKQEWVSVNHGVSGETSAQLLRRFYEQARGYTEASEICLWIGFNDAKGDGIPVDIFRKNIEGIFTVARFLGKNLLIGLLAERQGFGAPDRVDNKKIIEYNEVICDLVENDKRNDIWYVPLHKMPTEYFVDGVHFSNAGHIWVAERFLELIVRDRS